MGTACALGMEEKKKEKARGCGKVCAGLHAMAAFCFFDQAERVDTGCAHLRMPPCGRPGGLFLFQFLSPSLFFILFLFLKTRFSFELQFKHDP